MLLRIESLSDYTAPQLARAMLADAACVPPTSIVFTRLANGKPTSNLPLHFNCTHSGAYVACAVEDHPIGIDLEQVRSFHPRLLKTLDEQERIYWEQCPPSARNEAFFRLWTLKESWIKCRGGTLMEYRKAVFLLKEQALLSAPDGYLFRFHPAPTGYVLTTCEQVGD